jgi:hypothetical protein
MSSNHKRHQIPNQTQESRQLTPMKIVLIRNGKSGLVLKRKKRDYQIHKITHQIHSPKRVRITPPHRMITGLLVKKRK